MVKVTLSFPDHEEEDVVLADVPRKGDRIRLRNGRSTGALVVTDVLWQEAPERGAGPSVIVFVKIENDRADPRHD